MSLPSLGDILNLAKNKADGAPLLAPNPANAFCALGSAMEALKSLAGQQIPELGSQTRIVETDNAFEISMALPGVEEKHIAVSIAGGMLTIKAGRKSESGNAGPGFQVSQRSCGMIQHAMSLPPGADTELSVVRFSDGVLTVSLPKKSGP